MNAPQEIVENAAEFLRSYYKDEIGELALGYPKDGTSLWIDYDDLHLYDPDLADDLHYKPDTVLPALSEAVRQVDLPADIDLSGVDVRVYNVEQSRTYAPGEIRSEEAGRYLSVTGLLDRVTTSSDYPEELAFECERCGTMHYVPQESTADDLNQPHQCQGCERQGPFSINHGQSEWSDYAKLRIQSPPDASAAEDGKLPGFVIDDLIDVGGDSGLIGRAGEPVTVTGIVRRVQKSGRGENQMLFDHVMDVRAVEFARDNETVDVDAHRAEFEEMAARPDAVDLWADSLAPQLHTTDAWDAAMEFAVAYLFGAPRIDLENGPTYRGDLHFLMVSDYGMGKSTFKEDIAAYSPKCISKSTTALSSDVGLTAAAVKDDFGEGQWTLKPGLLVRANGGHLILDEIDKGPDELTAMNDALEGSQQVDIEKAGQSATYESRTGVMALGNPVDGRFDEHAPIAEQLGISESLLSRFDGIVTMSDHADTDQDERVAETWGRAYTESQEAEYGDRDEFDTLERPVPIDVGQAWIKYARENVNPLLPYEKFEELKTWYADEVRQLNNSFAEDGDGADMPVPATVRKLAATAKMAIAFARVHLRDEVTDADIERAKKLGKRLVKQNWSGDRFDATKNQRTQNDRKGKIEATLRNADEPLTTAQVAERAGLDERIAEDELELMARNGVVTRPQTGVYRYV